MQNLQVQPPLPDRIAELEKWHSRYEIDTMLLDEGYAPADVDAAWRRKNHTEHLGFFQKFWRGLGSRRSIAQFFSQLFVIFMCIVVPTWTISLLPGMFAKYSWYVENLGNLDVYQQYKLGDYELLPILYMVLLTVSILVISIVFIKRKQWRSWRYFGLMLYHALPFAGMVWLFAKFSDLQVLIR